MKLGFETETVEVNMEDLVPTAQLRSNIKSSHKYLTIAKSIGAVGIIEPPVVARLTENTFSIVDGHLRIEVLKDLGLKSASCLIATDDENYTYNRHVNRLATVQEHLMIKRAIERGISEELIAQALNINVNQVGRKRDLLKGICEQAVSLLAKQHVPPPVFDFVRKVKPQRQVEMAELMISAGNFNTNYAQALYAATKEDLLVNTRTKKAHISAEEFAKLEKEMTSIRADLSTIDDTFARNTLNLMVTKTFCEKILANQDIASYAARHHGDEAEQITQLCDQLDRSAGRLVADQP